jgi:hypothetical protein
MLNARVSSFAHDEPARHSASCCANRGPNPSFSEVQSKANFLDHRKLVVERIADGPQVSGGMVRGGIVDLVMVLFRSVTADQIALMPVEIRLPLLTLLPFRFRLHAPTSAGAN